MGLKICRDCGKTISKTADKCPYCGRKRFTLTRIIIFIFLLILAIGVWLGAIHPM